MLLIANGLLQWSFKFDNKSLRKSLHSETSFNKCEFTEKFSLKPA